MGKDGTGALVKYAVGEEEITLTPGIVRQYLVSGSGNATDQDVTMFMALCKFQHLNPFIKEAYLIKFGNQPAQCVVAKGAFMKRADEHPQYNGFEAGIYYRNEELKLEEREGSMLLGGEILVGGWATVHRKDHDMPVKASVSMDEYEQKKSSGEINSQWTKMPATMIRKVALVQALREAFPQEFQGMYEASEIVGADEAGEPVAMPTAKEAAETVEAEVVPEKKEAPEKEPVPEATPAVTPEPEPEPVEAVKVEVVPEEEPPETIEPEPDPEPAEAKPTKVAVDADAIAGVKAKCLAGLNICQKSGYLTQEEYVDFENEIKEEAEAGDMEALKGSHKTLQEIYFKKSRSK